MASALEAFRAYVPVESFAQQGIQASPEIQKPEVGLCWGKQAEFSYSAQSQPEPDPEVEGSGGDFTVENEEKPKTYQRIIVVPIDSRDQDVYVRDPADKDNYLTVRRISSMTFEYEEKLEKRFLVSPQRYRRSYWTLLFNLHPPNDEQA